MIIISSQIFGQVKGVLLFLNLCHFFLIINSSQILTILCNTIHSLAINLLISNWLIYNFHDSMENQYAPKGTLKMYISKVLTLMHAFHATKLHVIEDLSREKSSKSIVGQGKGGHKRFRALLPLTRGQHPHLVFSILEWDMATF